MSNYIKITDFAAKDSLLTGNPLKLITGTAHDNEYNAIAVAIATKLESGGALGTPSSGTLTNCTGLPLAGVTDSTTEALGVGSLEVGHASDTTITRVSAGTIAVEGVNVLTTATGSRIVSWVIKTTTYTAVAGDSLMCDTTGGAFTVTLPASPAANDLIRIADYAGTFATNNLTIGRNALNIMGLAEDMVVSTKNVSFTLTYIDATKGWILT